MAAKTKQQYYNIKPLLELDAEYNIIMGERSNGKTYSVLNLMLDDFFKTGRKGAYIRRYADEITPANMKFLFSPFEELIEKKSKGKYNKIGFRGKQFNIGLYDFEKSKWLSQEPLCFVAALNTWENSKGADKGVVGTILFDEFLTRRMYLLNEFTSFQNVLSSFIRDRGDAKIFMVGNTVSFYSPYFAELGLKDIKEMQAGDLNCFTFENGAKIAVDYCSSVGENKASAKFFNFNSKKPNMITTGQWDIPDYPHYGKSIDFKREVRFKFFIKFEEDILCGNIVSKRNEAFIYIHQQTKDVDLDEECLYSKTLDSNPLHCVAFRQGQLEVQKLIFNLISHNRVFFSDNHVGEIYSNFYKWQQRYSIVSI